MKIAVAQIRPKVASAESNAANLQPLNFNTDRHIQLIAAAVDHHAALIVFPELSFTGYEPTKAAQVARTTDDGCLEVFQKISDRDQISIGIGVPLQTSHLPTISVVLIRPLKPPLVYSKQYLHEDEVPYFNSGVDSPNLIHDDPAVALAICYELSVLDHASEAHRAGAIAYIASVAKTASAVATASQRLSQIASEFSMTVLMANSLGTQDGAECSGSSAVWNQHGELIAQLDNQNEGVIVYNLESGEVVSAVV